MKELEVLAREVASCRKCGLGSTRTHAVPGEGPSDADLLFVGEGPGWHEDQQARPFVGPAGKFLEELLLSIGLRRQQVFIGNIIKCRPPNNRDPLPGEIAACQPYLERQVGLIQPRLIVTLGRFSLAHFLPGGAIGRIHGVMQWRDGQAIFPCYPPAAALHQASLRRTIEADFLKIPAALDAAQAAAEPAEAAEPPAEQLSLF